MDEESIHRASSNKPENLEGKSSNKEVSEDVDFPFWKVVRIIICAPFYITGVLLASIISPDTPEYFVYSSFISMLLDPLFLYIPLIKEDTKCLMLDKKLTIAALILRLVTDLRYVVKIGSKIIKWRRDSNKKLPITTSDVVSILPIPQVFVLVFLPKMRGSGSLTIMKVLNSLILLQYLQRVYPIYRHCKNLNKKMHDESTTRPWIPSLVNLLIYILASYVIGTLWYFFSIQREIHCWEYACQGVKGCEFSTHCDTNTFRNITFLSISCPINPPNATVFDFGIFLYALQSGMQESTNLPQKFLLCFSWGLRNLSSFGSNLNTSTYGWETLFVVAISISGLVLFIYFLGHVQAFMQVAGKSERSRLKWKKILEPKIQSILSEYDFADDVENSIKYVVEKKISEDPDLVLENMFSIFSFKHKLDDQRLPVELNKIRHSLFMGKLKKLDDRLGLHMNEKVLEEICKHLEPVIYPKGSYIIREGEPLNMMFFITQGIARSTYTTDHNDGGRSTSGFSTTMRLKNGEYFGEKLLSWAAAATSDLPNSPRTVKAHKKVELFALQAADLKRVMSSHSGEELTHPTDITVHKGIQAMCFSSIQHLVLITRGYIDHFLKENH